MSIIYCACDSRTLYTVSGTAGYRKSSYVHLQVYVPIGHTHVYIQLAFPPFLGHQPVREHRLRARGECRSDAAWV